MKRLAVAIIALLVPGGLVVLGLWWLDRRQRQREYWQGPHYVDQIQVLRPDTPLALPPIRPLLARRWGQRWKKRA